MPALVWVKDDVAVELSSGIFPGSGDGLSSGDFFRASTMGNSFIFKHSRTGT
jgi:hypothetical protein